MGLRGAVPWTGRKFKEFPYRMQVPLPWHFSAHGYGKESRFHTCFCAYRLNQYLVRALFLTVATWPSYIEGKMKFTFT